MIFTHVVIVVTCKRSTCPFDSLLLLRLCELLKSRSMPTHGLGRGEAWLGLEWREDWAGRRGGEEGEGEEGRM